MSRYRKVLVEITQDSGLRTEYIYPASRKTLGGTVHDLSRKQLEAINVDEK